LALNLFKKKKNHRQRRQLIAHQQPISVVDEQLIDGVDDDSFSF
jgi:hypothetical protein